MSRRDALKEDGVEEPEMPPVDADYLLVFLWEIGPVMQNGMGGAPITHEELRAWQENTGIVLSAWQARTLKRLSADYLSESHAATKRDCKAPWNPDDAAPTVTDTQYALRALAHL